MAKTAAESLIHPGPSMSRRRSGIPPSGSSQTRYQFRLANTDDDDAIRLLLRQTPMEGPVSISLQCEPSFFQQATCDTTLHQTLIAIEASTNRVVAMGSRTVRPRFVDGQPTNVGYLSGLRILPEHRRGTLLARGYRELRRLHGDGAAEYYLTTIVGGNRKAFRSLEARRAGLPNYFLLGRYFSFVLPLGRDRSPAGGGGLEIRPMQTNQGPDLVEFLHREGKSRLFFPCYNKGDFGTSRATFKGLATEDILMAWRRNQLVGLIGTWNQTPFKQCVIEDYSRTFGWIRPAFNRLAPSLNWPTFPAIGQPMDTTCSAFPIAKDDDPDTMSQLLRAAGRHVRQQYPASRSILIGAFERDPLLEFLRKKSLYRFESSVFLVYWDQQVADPERFRDRRLYLELGCL